MSAKYRAGERQRKRESRRQAQREKGRQRSRARDRKQMRQFFVERTTWKFCSGADKGENEQQWKKGNENTYDIPSIKRVTKKFLACVAWRFWLLSNKGGRGQRNRISRLRRSCARLDKTAMLRRLRSFWKFHFVVVQNYGKEMYKKSVLHVQSCFFWLIRAIVVFHRSPELPSPLSITRFYILFEQTINVIESFAFNPG